MHYYWSQVSTVVAFIYQIVPAEVLILIPAINKIEFNIHIIHNGGITDIHNWSIFYSWGQDISWHCQLLKHQFMPHKAIFKYTWQYNGYIYNCSTSIAIWYSTSKSIHAVSCNDRWTSDVPLFILNWHQRPVIWVLLNQFTMEAPLNFIG